MSELERMWLITKLVRAYLAVECWGALVRVLPTAGVRTHARNAISRYEAIKRQIEGSRGSDPVANIGAGLHHYRVTYGTKTW